MRFKTEELFVVGIDWKNAHGGIRLVPARTTLHPRTRAEVAREAFFRSDLNLKTAKALGLTFPPTLITSADEVIG